MSQIKDRGDKRELPSKGITGLGFGLIVRFSLPYLTHRFFALPRDSQLLTLRLQLLGHRSHA